MGIYLNQNLFLSYLSAWEFNNPSPPPVDKKKIVYNLEYMTKHDSTPNSAQKRVLDRKSVV